MSIALVFLSLATFASALIAGLFYAYHWTVMPGLNAADPIAAINAMKSINVVIRNPIFFFSFFGTLVFGVIAAVLYLRSWGTTPASLVWGGFLVYALGVFVVTIVFNVPLNERLAATAPTPGTAANIWRAFYDPWMSWNLVRTVASIISFLLFGAAMWLEAMRPSS